MTASTLPVLPLPHPHILLPASRLALPVDRTTGLALLDLLAESEPLLAAVPVVPAAEDRPDTFKLNEWGAAARILRLVKTTSPRKPEQTYVVTLEAAAPARVRIVSPPTLKSPTPGKLLTLDVQYPSQVSTPAPALVESFRSAAIGLLDRLGKDSAQPVKKETWTRLIGMVEDMSSQRALWMADVLVSTAIPDYNDRLGARSLHSDDYGVLTNE